MEHTQEMMPGVSVTNLPPQNMTCKYSSHLSSGALCEVWCEIQELAGYQCVTCPQHYTQDPEALTLCSLWEEILKIENAGAALTVANPSPVECLYENNTSSAGPLCDLYCQLQSYNGHYCCPSQFTQDDERGLLCQLWSELEELNTANGPVTTTDFPLIPVDCIYEGNPTSSEPLCNVWCEIQAHKGSSCIECPKKYKNDPERIIICSLWSELAMINYDIVSAGAITTIVPQQNITCAYSDHLMSSDLLCEVWCKIQATKGLNCVFCPDNYKSDPESEQLCHLWATLVELEGGGDGPGDVSSLAPCPHQSHPTSSSPLCDLW